jgi:hypothetical protein
VKALQLSALLIFVFSVFGCATNEPPVLKKRISDMDLKTEKSDGTLRKRLMVLPFLDAGGVGNPDLRQKAREETIRALNKTQALIVVDSKELKVDWSKMTVGGEYNLTEIAKLANSMGVHGVMEAKLMDLKVQSKADPVGVFRQMKTKFESRARVRILAARTGRELYNTEKTITLEEANYRVATKPSADRFFQNNPELVEKLVTDTFLDFTPQIVSSMERMNWEGRVAMVTGERVFLNVGQVSGLKMGDLLKVTEDGDEVFDPQSGNYIGKIPGRLKGTLEVISFFGHDGAIAVVHSGAGFKENDRVELYY